MKSQYIYQNIFNIYWKIILDTSKTFKVNFFSEFGWYLKYMNKCCQSLNGNSNTRMNALLQNLIYEPEYPHEMFFFICEKLEIVIN